ncbi:methylmalonyl Co-A mutase-associated GTPase MeaB [Bergeyella sp. RCAD1439]|uniref:methylmalonyl Co-A mutase-associated GTPase MeaB n=1 Tax=Bergeyella anatis TaxID=3113737 RepID=UPI002E1964DC|nr:methylmalonyl Co-A mutase-associated GTPase MeaB [Bergeyella sp. RCAD1439]
MKISTSQLVEGVLSGNKRLLGKAITLVESKKREHRLQAEELLEALMPYTGNSVRIGVTGVPGAGKSTFIEHFGKLVIAKGKRVAVLAIDPSSSLSKGSILGDKTRMEALAKDENAFIRPSPSSGFLGGVANTTFETMLVCEAAGYDYILIETVGVGQSEVLVADISDVFLFLKIMGGGDELQGIKRGIMEMVDVIFINKVEEEHRQKALQIRQELTRALQFLPSKEEGWKVPVLMGSALYGLGLEEVYGKIEDFVRFKVAGGRFDQVRRQQAEKRFDYWVREYLLQRTRSQSEFGGVWENLRRKVSGLEANPSTEAKRFVDKLFG